MADDSKLPNIGGNGFIWILLMAAGTFFVVHQGPLEGSRPAGMERSLPQRIGEQTVDARLWQDPFAAVANDLEKSPELKPEQCDRRNSRYHDVEMHCRPPWEAQGLAPDLTLLALVSGTPYAEDQEARRRRRYAVLAGLDAEGFVPEDPQHIGFYWPGASASPPPSPVLQLATPPWQALRVQLPDSPPPSPDLKAPKIVAFEWFTPRPERTGDKTAYRRILLLWFDEDALAATDRATSAPATSPPRPAPLKQLGKFLCPYLSQPKAKVKILGPQLSTTLKAMVDEVNAHAGAKDYWSSICPRSASPQFYVADATVSDATLLPKSSVDPSCLASNTCLNRFFEQEKGIRLYRLTATDDALAGAIGEELSRRGIAPPSLTTAWYARYEAFVGTIGKKLGLGDEQDRHSNIALAAVRTVGDKLGLRPGVEKDRHSHIALVSEWDTLYGRALPDSMARCLGRSSCEPASENPYRNKDWLHRFKYLRGLDGQMPNVGGSGSGANAKDAGSKPDKDSKDSAKSPFDAGAKDRAEGQSQFDYLRRLGDRIQLLDRELRRDGKHGIEAVGVLGSDLYDKLLVLQALRPLLPDAWFFTTDLDALLLNPGAQTRTRNLLVASSFGLQLRPDLQGEIPPFRSSYQTAEFLATRIAIHSDQAPDSCWLRSPLLFEIGSSREFQFATAVPPPDDPKCKTALLDCVRDQPASQDRCTPAGTEGQRADHEDCKDDPLKCRLIQPIATAMVPQVGAHSRLALVAVGLGLVLCIPLSFRPLRRGAWHGIDGYLSGADSGRRLLGRGLVTLASLGAVVLLLGLALHLASPPLAEWLTRGGQPMTLLEGISVWPTILLRLVTLLLCIRLLMFSLQKLYKNMNKIEQDLHLGPTRQRVEEQWAGLVAGGPPWVRFARRWFGSHLPHVAGIRPGEDVSPFWLRYFCQERGMARFGRVLAGVAVMLVLWIILSEIFGSSRAPTRGDTSFVLYHIVTFALVMSTLVLIFFVADATWLCWRLTRDCRAETAIWPAATLQEFSNRFRLPAQYLDDWIDLIFVSKRTKCINTLLYWPFLIIALIVVSHSPLLARYGRSIPDVVAIGVALLIVIACAVALRWAAEGSRAKARRRLNEHLIHARGQADDPQLTGQLELLLRRVEELREGAFSPFSQQPLVRAMLLPLGTFGGTALLQYLLVPGFG
jgi:hypothetical protein